MEHLTQSRIAAALAAATQPEGERPWRLLLTKAPTTYAEVRSRIACAEDPIFSRFTDVDAATRRAEASRARVVNELARRDAYMAALSASEQMLSTTPALPRSIEIAVRESDGPEIRLFFHQDPAGLAAFAAHFDVPVSPEPHDTEGKKIYLSATGTSFGVSFEAWALVDATPAQVAA
ncbi:hypothetical protein ACWD7Y_05130 [Streptomyces drozdowiczii]